MDINDISWWESFLNSDWLKSELETRWNNPRSNEGW